MDDTHRKQLNGQLLRIPPSPRRPEASQHAVASNFLTDLEVDSEETRKAVVSFIPAAFASVGAMAKQFYAAERRCGGWVGVAVRHWKQALRLCIAMPAA